jgi:hypothetical protein
MRRFIQESPCSQEEENVDLMKNGLVRSAEDALREYKPVFQNKLQSVKHQKGSPQEAEIFHFVISGLCKFSEENISQVERIQLMFTFLK